MTDRVTLRRQQQLIDRMHALQFRSDQADLAVSVAPFPASRNNFGLFRLSGEWNDDYDVLADVAPADGPGQVALRAWPGLAARHTILDVIGCLLANRCQLEKLLFYG